mmetsp:Transcript_100321/g.281107  ORF Transcript_100321/g.281107 Transcript_100321/m.281107 type:complete len:105 (-) Transcript_100321:91-405(-)
MPLGDRKVSVGLVGFEHAVKGHQLASWRKLDEYRSPRGYGSGDMPWGPHWTPVSAGAAPVKSKPEESHKMAEKASPQDAEARARKYEDGDDEDEVPVEEVPPPT